MPFELDADDFAHIIGEVNSYLLQSQAALEMIPPEYDEALQMASKARDIALMWNLHDHVARCEFFRGDCYRLLRRWEDALKCYGKCVPPKAPESEATLKRYKSLCSSMKAREHILAEIRPHVNRPVIMDRVSHYIPSEARRVRSAPQGEPERHSGRDAMSVLRRFVDSISPFIPVDLVLRT